MKNKKPGNDIFLDYINSDVEMSVEELTELFKQDEKTWPLGYKLKIKAIRLKNKHQEKINIKKNNKQRAKNGYGMADLWSFNFFLADIISRGCKELAETSHGYPSDEDECQSFENWKDILLAISLGFKLMDETNYTKRTEQETEDINRAWRLFQKYFEGLWD